MTGERSSNSIGGHAQLHGTTVMAQRVQLTINQALAEPDPAVAFVVPSQVPRPLEHFVNRADKLGLLWSMAEATGRRYRPLVVVVSGAGGVGKTEFGRVWAHDAGALFPDGRLHLDLAPLRRGGTVEIAEVLAELLRGLGLAEAAIAATRAGRAGQYLSRTDGRRLLVVLDGVHQTDDLEDLLPASPHSVVLVISHHRRPDLEDRGALALPLGPLAEEHARALLTHFTGAERAEAEPESTAELLRMCAGLPVALLAAGSRLARRPRWSVSRLVGELRDETARLERLGGGRSVVEALWDATYLDLPQPAARMYRLLCDHPGPDSTVESAAALAGYDLGQSEDALLELVRASLLDQDDEGRFRLHDLIRLHARGWAQAEHDGADHEAALTRVDRWYRRQAERADRAAKGDRLRIAEPLTPDQAPGPDIPFAGAADAIAWLERERQALFGVVRRAADAGRHEAAWATAEPLGVLFESHRHYADCIDAFTHGVKAADRDGNQRARAWLRCLLARPLWELGQYERAGAQLDTAFAAAEASGYRRLQAAVWERSGKLRQARGDLGQAESDFARSRAVNEEINHPRGVMLQLYHLAGLRTLRDAPGEAIELLGQAAVLAEGGAGRTPDERMKGRIAQATGVARIAMGELRQAEEPLRLALRVAVGRGAAFDEAQARDLLAEIVTDPAEAAEHRRRADEVYAAAGGLRPRSPDGGDHDPHGPSSSSGTAS